MRVVAIMLALLLTSASAVAQSRPCEESISGPAGEVVVMRDADAASAIWVVARQAGIGEESDNFARPGLELEMALKPDGGFGDVISAFVSVTRFEDRTTTRAPSMRSVVVRALADGRSQTWRGDEDGSAKLAAALGKAWPATLVVELAPAGGGPAYASATFDLSRRGQAQGLVRQALARCTS